MRALLKMRWVFLLIWIAATVGLVSLAPNMEQLVRDKGNISIPDKYSSQVARQILNRHTKNDGNNLSAVLVFHSKNGIGTEEEKEINRVLDRLKDKKDTVGIAKLTTYRDNEEAKKQLMSKDKKTIITPIEVERKKRKPAEIRNDLEKAVGTAKVEHYFTGESFIGEDVVVSSQNGLKKTELITVVFILLVLILVFRSIVAPLIPLITVGISYVVSAAVVGILVDKFNFPLSNFTQIFMVAILFGIGTDYCILLLSRFKEELPNHETVGDAIIKTYQTAGKTVFFSALAVLIGFSSIGLSKFSLYKSSTGVAVGVFVLLIALLTLVPLAMYVLGPRLFWPAKSVSGHGDSKIWGAFGSFSLTKPIRALLLVAVVVVPLLVSYNGKLSFNSLNEIGENYSSVKGFNTIADSFGPGEVMPVQVIIESDKNLDNEKSLATIEKISREIAKVSAVEKVRSATRPIGEPVKEFYVADQAKSLNNGIGQGTDGLNKIQDGLNAAAGGTDGLITGTKGLKNGAEQIRTGLSAIEKGLREGSMNAGQLQDGLQQMYEKIQGSIGDTKNQATQFDQLIQLLQGVKTTIGAVSQIDSFVNQSFAEFEKKNGAIVLTPDYQILKGKVTGATGNPQLKNGLQQLSTNLDPVMAGLEAGKAKIATAASQQQQLADALKKLADGAGQFKVGIGQAADGQNQIISKLPEFIDGLSKVNDGQEKLKDGISQSADGLGKVSGGLQSAQSYLDKLTKSPDKEMTGFYVPSVALENSDFQQVFDMYLSKDKKVAKFDVVLKYNPYANEALKATKDIKAAVKRSLVDTDLEESKYGVAGVSAIASDMLQASDSDYTQTVIYMLIGITIILVVLLRSIVMPLYLIVSLVLCFYSALSINELIFVNILGYDGINWTMPFFGFVILMALGVDYSIFLMDRFNEYKGMDVKEAMLLSMRNMGTVIFSAVIILGGTFAAMYPANVLSLMQIATIVLAGLVLYAVIFLPFFIPVMVRIFGRANWFPFDRNQKAN